MPWPVTDPVVVVPLLAASMATGLGSLALVVTKGVRHRTHDSLLGFSAGIMLGVAALSLPPLWSEPAGIGVPGAVLGLSAGVALVAILARAFRRMPLPMPFVRNSAPIHPGTAFLLFVALAIHNAPEGIATALGYAGGLTPGGHSIALSIAVQNIPEGLLVSLAVFAETQSRKVAVAYCLVSGAVEPVAGILALLLLSAVPAGLGIASAFAVGAMVAVVALQMIPESHRHGHHIPATLALGVGFALVPLFGWLATSVAG